MIGRVAFLILFFASLSLHAQMVVMGGRPNFTLDEKAKTALVDNIASRVESRYLFPDLASKISAALRDKLRSGEFREASNPPEFAQKVTQILRDVSHDKHMSVAFDPRMARDMMANDRLPEADRKPPVAMLKNLRSINYGFEKEEILKGNVGYLNLTQFSDLELASDAAASAMNFLTNADAVIIDLRQNGGGDGATVAFLCSYFFGGPPKLVNTSWYRDTTKNEQSWTAGYLPGKRMPDVPVFLLTSRMTFSAAEEFAYDLQSMKRATIVGEATGGGAHHNDFIPIDSNFVMSVSIGQAINPITHTNWEGTGVKPDVGVPADQALDAAHAAALRKIREKTTDEQERRTIDWTLETLTAESHPVSLSESALRKFAGTYGERVITFEDGSLYYQRKGRPKYKMIPMSENLFRFGELDFFRLRFVKGDDGKMKLSGLYDNGMVD